MKLSWQRHRLAATKKIQRAAQIPSLPSGVSPVQNTQAVASDTPATEVLQLPILYPEISRQRGEEGVVDLRVAVNQAGLVEEVIILKSSGFKRLDAEAARAAKSLEGAGAGVRDFSVRFKLDNI